MVCAIASCTPGQSNKNGKSGVVNDDFEENDQLKAIFREDLTDCFEEYNNLVLAFNTRDH